MVHGMAETIDNVKKALKKVAANMFLANSVKNMKACLHLKQRSQTNCIYGR